MLCRFSAYDISYEGVTLTFHLVLVEPTVDCAHRACIIFMEFICDNIKTFAFIKYAIVCVPLDTHKILFLRHYRSASDGWRTYKLCAACCRDWSPSVRQFINNCTFSLLLYLPKYLQMYNLFTSTTYSPWFGFAFCLPSHFQIFPSHFQFFNCRNLF